MPFGEHHQSDVARLVVQRVAEILDAVDVPVMPLGGALLRHTVYPEPEERPLGDVLLALPAQVFDRGLRALADAGFQERPAGDPLKRLFVTNGRPVWTVAVTCQVFPEGRYRLSTADMFLRSQRDEATFGVHVRRADPHDVYAHLVGTFAAVPLGPADLPQLRDFGLVARAHRLEAARLANHLRYAGLARAARYALGLASDTYGDESTRHVLSALHADSTDKLISAAARLSLAHPVLSPWARRIVPRTLGEGFRSRVARHALRWAADAESRYPSLGALRDRS